MSQKDEFFNKREKIYGQFFTPPKISDFIVNFSIRFLDKKERAIDPACGDGVFLDSLLKVGFKEVWGIDIDPSVINIIPKHVKDKAKIIIADALIKNSILGLKIPENFFDLVVGNPPFSSKYGRVKDSRLLYYELGKNKTSQAIEVLFLERFLQLAREGGVIGIILPEGIFANTSMIYVRRFILRYKPIAIISLPRNVFRGSLSTSAKTHILFLKKEPNDNNATILIDIDDIDKLNVDYVLKYGLRAKVIPDNLTPRYYINSSEIIFDSSLIVKQLKDLVQEIRTGATEYGKYRVFSNSGIKFISAKVITPYGLDFNRDLKFVKPGSKMDKPKAYVRPGDILFVRVGVGCSGRVCVAIDENDVGIADDWIYIIRLKDKEFLPYYVAIYMQSKFGKIQIDSMKRGVATVNIPKTELLKLKIPILDMKILYDIREKYIEMVHNLRAKKYDVAKEIFNKLLKTVEINFRQLKF